MSDTGDSQDLAEALDDDKLPGDHEGPDVEPEYPLDVPLGLDQYGLTAAEEEIPEPESERDARDSADPLATELDAEVDLEDAEAAGTTLDAQLDALEVELDDDEIADLDEIAEDLEVSAEDDAFLDDEVGRLSEPGVDDDVLGSDTEPDSVAVAYDQDDLSAEEAAVHLTADPPFHDPSGGYLD